MFTINPVNIASIIDNESDVGRELARYGIEIRDIGDSLGFKIAESHDLRNRISDAAERLDRHQRAVCSLSRALADAVDSYECAESDIINANRD